MIAIMLPGMHKSISTIFTTMQLFTSFPESFHSKLPLFVIYYVCPTKRIKKNLISTIPKWTFKHQKRNHFHDSLLLDISLSLSSLFYVVNITVQQNKRPVPLTTTSFVWYTIRMSVNLLNSCGCVRLCISRGSVKPCASYRIDWMRKTSTHLTRDLIVQNNTDKQATGTCKSGLCGLSFAKFVALTFLSMLLLCGIYNPAPDSKLMADGTSLLWDGIVSFEATGLNAFPSQAKDRLRDWLWNRWDGNSWSE